MSGNQNLSWHASKISLQDRWKLNGHKSGVLWFTGLSGSGKSTITRELEKVLHGMGVRAYRLDGDNVRFGLNKDLGFKPDDRSENIRRIGEVSKLMTDAGLIVLASFITPYEKDRQFIRNLLSTYPYAEVYVKAKLETCEARDPKGLYKQARSGKLKNFTGIDAPFEEPGNPDLVIDTEQLNVDQSVKKIIEYMKKRQFFSV